MSNDAQSTFGPNAWLVDDMYEQYREDPQSVSESWREFFQDYRPGGANLARPSTPQVTVPEGAGPEETRDRPGRRRRPRGPAGAVRAAAACAGHRRYRTCCGHCPYCRLLPLPRPPPPPRPPRAGAPPSPTPAPATPTPAPARAPEEAEPAVPLRGAAGRVVANMTASLGVPTATSFRVVPARLLEVNRKILNNQIIRTGSAGKVSFTHLIGYAVVEAMKAVPVMNSSFVAAPSRRSEGASIGCPPPAPRPRVSRWTPSVPMAAAPFWCRSSSRPMRSSSAASGRRTRN